MFSSARCPSDDGPMIFSPGVEGLLVLLEAHDFPVTESALRDLYATKNWEASRSFSKTDFFAFMEEVGEEAEGDNAAAEELAALVDKISERLEQRFSSGATCGDSASRS